MSRSLKRSPYEIEKWNRTDVLGTNYRYQRDNSGTMGREKRGLSNHSTSVRNDSAVADFARGGIVSCGASQTNVQPPL